MKHKLRVRFERIIDSRFIRRLKSAFEPVRNGANKSAVSIESANAITKSVSKSQQENREKIWIITNERRITTTWNPASFIQIGTNGICDSQRRFHDWRRRFGRRMFFRPRYVVIFWKTKITIFQFEQFTPVPPSLRPSVPPSLRPSVPPGEGFIEPTASLRLTTRDNVDKYCSMSQAAIKAVAAPFHSSRALPYSFVFMYFAFLFFFGW